MNRVTPMPDTSGRDERVVCWCIDEHLWGYTVGGSGFLKEFGPTWEDLPVDLGGLEAALLRWNQVYETVRPHQASGYKTPDRFYQDWLSTHPT